jgi:hypothetical protein
MSRNDPKKRNQMTKKSRRSAPKLRTKYFNMEDSDISAYRVVKKRSGYYLYGCELGQIGGASDTILDALSSDGIQYGGSSIVKIDTNVPLGELFAILNSPAFWPAMHNASTFVINEAEIDKESLRNILLWYYKQMRN